MEIFTPDLQIGFSVLEDIDEFNTNFNTIDSLDTKENIQKNNQNVLRTKNEKLPEKQSEKQVDIMWTGVTSESLDGSNQDLFEKGTFTSDEIFETENFKRRNIEENSQISDIFDNETVKVIESEGKFDLSNDNVVERNSVNIILNLKNGKWKNEDKRDKYELTEKCLKSKKRKSIENDLEVENYDNNMSAPQIFLKRKKSPKPGIVHEIHLTTNNDCSNSFGLPCCLKKQTDL